VIVWFAGVDKFAEADAFEITNEITLHVDHGMPVHVQKLDFV
jgi:hypothetical protein